MTDAHLIGLFQALRRAERAVDEAAGADLESALDRVEQARASTVSYRCATRRAVRWRLLRLRAELRMGNAPVADIEAIHAALRDLGDLPK